MKAVANLDKVELTTEERDLLSVAFEQAVGAKRDSWEIISSTEQKETNDKHSELAKTYKTKMEKEIQAMCEDMLEALDKLIATAESTKRQEDKVIYHRMKGDAYRYLAEIAVGAERTEAENESLQAYKTAKQLAEEELPTTDPIRLEVALNLSEFYYEILNDPDSAMTLAKSAFDAAIAELDALNEDDYKEFTRIMQLLRDNLTLWTSDIP
ncbi:14-3-3-like protein [Antedon mediterranea]|uniref:14-3-3-like protein n=1 Tax=Antedon mediterranea TaxID=105859 RepID=UPI003AF43307